MPLYSTRKRWQELILRYQKMQSFSQYITNTLDKPEALSDLVRLLNEYKRTSSTLSSLVEETQHLYSSVYQSCKHLAELEEWINNYIETMETSV